LKSTDTYKRSIKDFLRFQESNISIKW
jgi:hypothetical protein